MSVSLLPALLVVVASGLVWIDDSVQAKMREARARTRDTRDRTIELTEPWRSGEWCDGLRVLRADLNNIDQHASAEDTALLIKAAVIHLATPKIEHCAEFEASIETLRSTALHFYDDDDKDPFSRARSLIDVCTLVVEHRVWRAGVEALAGGISVATEASGDPSAHKGLRPADLLEALALSSRYKHTKLDVAVLTAAEVHGVEMPSRLSQHTLWKTDVAIAELSLGVYREFCSRRRGLGAGNIDMSEPECRDKGLEGSEDLCAWLTGWPRMCVYMASQDSVAVRLCEDGR